MERVQALFQEQHRRGAFPGGNLVVRIGGKEVLNASAGLARGFREGEGERLPASSETLFQVMSASKPVVALAVAVLEDAGLVDVDAPVGRYIPLFTREGKEDITVLDVLTHRSGVVLPQLQRSPEVWADWERVQHEICFSAPRFPRGTLAYHPFEFGWILGELVHRVSGLPLDEFLHEVLPPELSGLRLRLGTGVRGMGRTYWLGRRKYRLGGEDIAGTFEEDFNAPSTRASLVPGASMFARGSSLALFYEMIAHGGTLPDGTRVVRAETLDRYLQRHVAGFDRITRTVMMLGRGFLLGSRGPHVYAWFGSQHCAGHGGGFCALGFCDRKTGAAVAILTNGNRGVVDALRRFAPLGSAIRKSLKDIHSLEEHHGPVLRAGS